VAGVGACHQIGEEQSGRPAANDSNVSNVHAFSRAWLNCEMLRRI
jgi:hypothetical protein